MDAPTVDVSALPTYMSIALAGPIGAGKTTAGQNLAKTFSKNGKTSYFYEELMPDYVCDLLAKSNDDPKRWMELFQTVMVMRAVLREQQATQSVHDITITERPLEESKVFGNANLVIGRVSPEYFDNLYSSLHAFHGTPNRYNLIVYLHVDEQTAEKRRGLRNRPAEDRYGDAYTNALADAYYDWVLQCCKEGRMLVIDWNEFQPIETLVKAIIKALQNPEALAFTPTRTRHVADMAARRHYQNSVLADIAKTHALSFN